MLNYVAFYLVSWMLRTPGLLQAPGSSNPKTPPMKDTAIFPALLGPQYNLHFGFILVIVAAVVRLVAPQPLEPRLPVPRRRREPATPRASPASACTSMYIYAMLIAGAPRRSRRRQPGARHVTTGFTAGIDAGIGFDAITVALLGRSDPWGIFVAGILFGAFKAGGFSMQAAEGMPIDIVLVVQSLIVLFIAAPPLVRTIFRLPDPGAAEAAEAVPDVAKEVAAK